MTDEHGNEGSGNSSPKLQTSTTEAHDSNNKHATKQKANKTNTEHHKSLRRSWGAASPITKLEIVFAGIIAGCTALYCLFAGWTLYEIRSSSADTHALAVAASKQASHTEAMATAARNISEAADRFSASANSINQQTTLAVNQFRRLAKATEDSVSNTAEASHLDQRAWIGIGDLRIVQFEAGKAIKIDVSVTNSGKTPALNVRQSGKYTFYRAQIPGPTASDLFDLQPKPIEAIPPQGKYSSHFEVSLAQVGPHWISIHENREFLYIYGKFSYDILSSTSERQTEYCIRLTDVETTPQLVFCDEGNNMN